MHYTIEQLQDAVTAAHDCAVRAFGREDTCIKTSVGLANALGAELVRMSLVICRGGVLSLCGVGDDLPGKWAGHLVVVVNNKYLLDATVSQFNRGECHFSPIAMLMPPEWESGVTVFFGSKDWSITYTQDSRIGWEAFAKAHESESLLVEAAVLNRL